MTDAMKIELTRGTYMIIRIDGSEEFFIGAPYMATIERQIGATGLDTVTLTRKGRDADLVMIVDDTGMIDGRPVNPIATSYYHAICKPNTPFSIHGDVAIVHDGDFR